MGGADEQPRSMFSYASLEECVPADHPLQAIRRITDRVLERLSPRLGTLYIKFGRPSIRSTADTARGIVLLTRVPARHTGSAHLPNGSSLPIRGV